MPNNPARNFEDNDVVQDKITYINATDGNANQGMEGNSAGGGASNMAMASEKKKGMNIGMVLAIAAIVLIVIAVLVLKV
jgi:t-SNARE complex subunit (syntaxin)